MKRSTQLGVKESNALDINIITATRYNMIDRYALLLAAGQKAKGYAASCIAARLGNIRRQMNWDQILNSVAEPPSAFRRQIVLQEMGPPGGR